MAYDRNGTWNPETEDEREPTMRYTRDAAPYGTAGARRDAAPYGTANAWSDGVWADSRNLPPDAYEQTTPDDDLEDALEDDPEEVAQAHRERFRLASGLWDFGAVIVGAALILLLVAVLTSLYQWLQRDIGSSLALWFRKM